MIRGEREGDVKSEPPSPSHKDGSDLELQVGEGHDARMGEEGMKEMPRISGWGASLWKREGASLRGENDMAHGRHRCSAEVV